MCFYILLRALFADSHDLGNVPDAFTSILYTKMYHKDNNLAQRCKKYPTFQDIRSSHWELRSLMLEVQLHDASSGFGGRPAAAELLVATQP